MATFFQTGQQLFKAQTGLMHFDNGGANIGAMKWTVGTVIVNGATPVTVTQSAVTSNSLVIFTLKTVGGTVGAYPAIQTITPGTGFTVAATAGDTSVYTYAIIG